MATQTEQAKTDEPTVKRYSGDDTVSIIKQFIRYDIPCLLVGKSSIGKSYSLIELTKMWNMPNSLLHIGSEKPENIEGMPIIVGTKVEESDTLTYLKPYWFPNEENITKHVKRCSTTPYCTRENAEKMVNEADK